MKRSIIFNSILVIIVIAASSFIFKKTLYHKKNGGGIVGKTGSPGESLCSQCHGGGGGVSSVVITSSPAFIANEYTPAQTYTITITVNNSSFTQFGFDTEILTTTNTNAGTMSAAFTGVQFFNFGSRKNATHTTPMGGAGSASFSFEWVAPVSGRATIYAGGNAINGNLNTSGDSPASTSLILMPDNHLSIKSESDIVLGLNVFPNPVIADLKLNYSLVNAAQVKISLYDLQGKEIKELVNETQSEGYHALNTALPEDLSKGLYFVKMNLGDKAPVQRLVVVQ